MSTRLNPTPTIYDVATMAGVSISTVSLALNAPSRVKAVDARAGAGRDRRSRLRPEERGGDARTPRDRADRGDRAVHDVPVVRPAPERRPAGGPRAQLRGRRVRPGVGGELAARDAAAHASPRRADRDVAALQRRDRRAPRRTEACETILVEFVRDGFSSVTIDDAAGGRMVAELLLARGHERFGFIGEEQRSHHYLSQSEARLAGFREALAARGHELPDAERPPHVAQRSRRRSAPRGELLDLPEPPTAIFAHDDLLASAALKVARAARPRRCPASSPSSGSTTATSPSTSA